jgi:glycosyltransferase involved in cell wall biosynthesis
LVNTKPFKKLTGEDMRIMLIITDYGSFNNFIGEVAVKLIGMGHKVDVICSKTKVIDYEDKYPYHELGINFHFLHFPRSFNLLKQLSCSKKIADQIEQIRPDLINIHFTTAIFTTLLVGKPNFFTVGTIHGIGYPKVKGRIKRKIFEIVEKFCFRRLDQIYLINNFDFDLVREMHPEKAYLYNSYGVGCDFKKFDPDSITDHVKTDFRKRLGIAPDDFVLAFTGRFVSFKGFDLVVRAMLDLSRRPEYKHIKLLLIGGKDPAHITGLTKHEEEFCLRNKQILRVGFTADVNLYLSITELFVFPSAKEGMPVCIMEALSMGVPVITSDSRGCNDLVKNGINGLLLAENPSVTEISGAILKLFRDRQYLNRLRENAIHHRNGLNRDKYVDDQIEIYGKLVSYF